MLSVAPCKIAFGSFEKPEGRPWPTGYRPATSISAIWSRLTTDWIERLATALDCDPLELLGAHAEELTEQERLLLKVFRTLNEDQKKAFLAAAVALAKSGASS